MLIACDINTCHEQEDGDFSKILFISLDRSFFYTLRNLLSCLEQDVFAKNVRVLFEIRLQ
jgi:hypothetical protein